VYPGLILPIPGVRRPLLALAFPALLLEADARSCPLRSQTKSIKYLEENWAAKDVKLSEDELREIRKVIEENPVKGDQYSEQLQALLDE